MTRVVIAGDRDGTLPGLNGMRVRDQEIAIVGSAPTVSEAIDLCKTLRPNLVILDVGDPGAEDLEATRQIKHVDRLLKVMFLTTYDEPSYVWRAMLAGADAYLYRSCSSSLVLESIRRALYNEEYLSPEVNAHFLRWVNGGPGVLGADPGHQSARDPA